MTFERMLLAQVEESFDEAKRPYVKSMLRFLSQNQDTVVITKKVDSVTGAEDTTFHSPAAKGFLDAGWNPNFGSTLGDAHMSPTPGVSLVEVSEEVIDSGAPEFFGYTVAQITTSSLHPRTRITTLRRRPVRGA